MSGDHSSDCSEVLEKVWLYLDGEMSADQLADIRVHLDECSPCLRAYGLEQAVKALVARKCGCEPAPEELRLKLMATLHRVRVEAMQVEYRAD